MKPTFPRFFVFVATCLSAVFFPGCASLTGPPMEEKLLHQSIIRSDSEGALKIINSGVLDGQIDSTALGMTSLYLAAEKNDTNVVQALLAKGANPNLALKVEDPDRNGETPVHGAARKRNAEALKLLLAHGGSVLVHAKFWGSTPFDISVSDVEPPGPVTDMLIEAGAEVMGSGTRKNEKPHHYVQMEYVAGTHWAVASYMERHAKFDDAIQHYDEANRWFESSSKKVLGSAKWWAFMNSPGMRSVVSVGAIATTAAAGSQGTTIIWGDPNPILAPLGPNIGQGGKDFRTGLKDVGERYAAYSKLCADRSAELKRSQNRSPSSDSGK